MRKNERGQDGKPHKDRLALGWLSLRALPFDRQGERQVWTTDTLLQAQRCLLGSKALSLVPRIRDI